MENTESVPFVKIVMKNFSVKNQLLLIITLLVVVFLFYWFQWRPSQIRNQCQKEADERRAKDFVQQDKDRDGLLPMDIQKEIIERSKFTYSNCLHRKGFE